MDTTVLFPHRLGLPHKRSLKSLVADYLQRIIQDDGKSLFANDKYQGPMSDLRKQTMWLMVKVLPSEMLKVGSYSWILSYSGKTCTCLCESL